MVLLRPSRAGLLLRILSSALPLAASGCAGESPAEHPRAARAEPAVATDGPLRPLAGAVLGDPIPGLTPAQQAAFRRGRALFEKRFTPDEGLGPHYNATSCASCHSTPVTGGSSELYRNFYVAMIGEAPDQSALAGLPSPVVPAFGPRQPGGSFDFTLEEGRHVIPESWGALPVVVAQRNAIPVFGTGLFEFVPNAEILERHDPLDSDGDGISGRVNGDAGDVGRFGVKAQSNNVERFTRPPLRNQMGITTDPFEGSQGTVSLSSAPLQGTVDPDVPLIDGDDVPDPELSHEELGDLIAFTRFLAPPDRLPFDAEALQGQALFDEVGCAACHVPSLDSSLGPVEAYTDLLLHDMGPELADGLQFGAPFAAGASVASEFRTQPLWGVSMHAPFLHDGRAETLLEAIETHGGEAAPSRDRFLDLDESERAAVLAFLEAL